MSSQQKEAIDNLVRKMTAEQAKAIWQQYMAFSLRYPRATFASFAKEDDQLHRPNRAEANRIKDEIMSLIGPNSKK